MKTLFGHGIKPVLIFILGFVVPAVITLNVLFIEAINYL